MTLDVYSGRPNPVWFLGNSEAKEFKKRLAALPLIKSSELPLPPGLGYRGIHIDVQDSFRLQGPLVVYRGLVQTPRGNFRDQGRSLERWLLETANGAVELQTRDYVRGEIDKTP